jgi:hypothetical protein
LTSNFPTTGLFTTATSEKNLVGLLPMITSCCIGGGAWSEVKKERWFYDEHNYGTFHITENVCSIETLYYYDGTNHNHKHEFVERAI